ncbi:MerR family transcriptional regulator [Kutzneria buriramensis]|uniref:DNA-binding transcriptional MerR regulator n=1 Tax=Kutzneria buriramensis TaxID=1045776 RepID=A0A3E0HIJ8_9PSEU|nr:MerR family transcriptional regulator [Kutzneria buriramensis]REH46180.1 DNA-binding transcriptional MerR regulator [Kutzneria buriramensis]
MPIGELSKATGVSSRALRYYEQQGLLRSERRPNGYREYALESIEVVAFVQDLFHAGLSSDVVRDILPCARDEHPRGDCAELLARVRQVRDELVRQEHHIAERRQRLDAYLADGYLADGYEARPAR